jgi:two-component system, cell cycle response regulator
MDASSLNLLTEACKQWECRLLIVDCNDGVCARMAAWLTLEGYKVGTAPTVAEALWCHRTKPYHLVIIIWDQELPDGPALCRTLRESHNEAYVYIVIMTAERTTADVQLAYAAGADDLICKFDALDEILARIETGKRIMREGHAILESICRNYKLAMTDPLTESNNRRFLIEMLPREISRSKRYQRPLSILCCDIDSFKQVNDQYGHQTGDEVLTQFVAVARACVREPIDWVARVGGEEFVVVMPETDIAGALVAAERIRIAFSQAPLLTPAAMVGATVSIGAASIQAFEEYENASMAELLRAADRCLYVSKRMGRNCSTASSMTEVSRSAPNLVDAMESDQQ